MPTQQAKNAPLHDHDLELANRGGVLLSDSAESSEQDSDSAQEKRDEQTRHRAEQTS